MRLPNSVAFDGYGGISISFQPYFLALTVHRASNTGPSELLSTTVAVTMLVCLSRP